MRTTSTQLAETIPQEAVGIALLHQAAQASAILYHPVRIRILEALLRSVPRNCAVQFLV